MLRIGERTDDFQMNQDDWQKLLKVFRVDRFVVLKYNFL